MKEIKKRNWAVIVYPESMPADWLDILTETGLPIAISPLHDSDINESTGEPKKAHYHVILCFNSPTSFNVVSNLTAKLNAPIPKAIESVKGAYRYLVHQDNPEKAQYDPNNIRLLNGFNVQDYAEMSFSENLALKNKLVEYVQVNGIIEYSDLVTKSKEDGLTDIFDYASEHTLFCNSFITSLRNKAKERLDERMSEIEQAEKQIHKIMTDLNRSGSFNFDDYNKIVELFGSDFEVIVEDSQDPANCDNN